MQWSHLQKSASCMQLVIVRARLFASHNHVHGVLQVQQVDVDDDWSLKAAGVRV